MPAERARTTTVAGDERPALARSVLLRYDRVRGAELLLMPERAVVLSPEAGRILRLCDGHRTVAGIIAALAAEHPDAPLERDVPEFVARIRAEGWLQ
ncbi:pyrroloquinoline quinone biosynthesis peptide chaperone PqqD [Actinomadura opuntiae]|uniref:pyrroloquinoline quinone biosynthesis peptide chaperone PqqD n=1 Tax=Actinomadura sp. OS1-43 TaxID=604315 RepID=UPI00255A94F6|nr:pyrroloquinoline quinone biosynthesis peptide chaperone PqqD [Actinomadura sp. OS1-43]MDL4814309.1 pyrroloquinoline quinone biosynthesis peptide chaperone PqqD [Actinomadura sp. OS1-43]